MLSTRPYIRRSCAYVGFLFHCQRLMALRTRWITAGKPSINTVSRLSLDYILTSKDSAHDPAEWFSASRAARLAGLSHAMVNYLCRTSVVSPSCNCPRGRGVPRHYSFGDVVALRLVAKLSKAGISPLRLRKGLESLRAYHPQITLSSLPATHLVTDGQSIFLRSANHSLERATDGQYAFAFVVELEHMRQEVVNRMPAAQRKTLGAK